MSEQWGTLSTKHISFEDVCRSLLSIPAARACTSQNELVRLLDYVFLHQNDQDPTRVDGELHGWAYDQPDNISAAFRQLVNDHPHAHVRAYYTDTRGYEPEETWIHTPSRARSDELFGELRGALGHGASRETFEAVADVVGDLKPDPRVLEYLRAHVDAWPDDVERPAPLEWLWNYHQWGETELLSLCNRVEIPYSDDDTRDALSPLHVSFRVLGVDVLAVVQAIFSGNMWISPNRSNFLYPYQGVSLYQAAPGVTECTLHSRNRFMCSNVLYQLQRHLPDRLVHVYACNDHGDFAYTEVHRNNVKLYHEDLRAPLDLEAMIVDPRGVELSFDPSKSLRPGTSRSFIALLDAMGEHARLLQHSRLSDSFANVIPSPEDDPVTPAAEDMRRCLLAAHDPREGVTSRDDYLDPLNGDDDIPF